MKALYLMLEVTYGPNNHHFRNSLALRRMIFTLHEETARAEAIIARIVARQVQIHRSIVRDLLQRAHGYSGAARENLEAYLLAVDFGEKIINSVEQMKRVMANEFLYATADLVTMSVIAEDQGGLEGIVDYKISTRQWMKNVKTRAAPIEALLAQISALSSSALLPDQNAS